MELFLKALFSKGTATGIAALLLFTSPKIIKKQNQIIVSGKLKGVFTKKVNRILNTGTEISFIYDIALIIYEKEDARLLKKKVIHKIKYDPLKAKYSLDLNGEKITRHKKERAIHLIESYQVMFDYPKKLENPFASFYVEAEIDYSSSLNIKIPPLALWDYYIPNLKLKSIKIEVLE